jgi:hypothetical protein
MIALKPKDMVAIVIILAFTFLLFNNYTGPIYDFMGILIGFYFGQRKSGVDSGH